MKKKFIIHEVNLTERGTFQAWCSCCTRPNEYPINQLNNWGNTMECQYENCESNQGDIRTIVFYTPEQMANKAKLYYKVSK